jgi:hypothetical protein
MKDSNVIESANMESQDDVTGDGNDDIAEEARMVGSKQSDELVLRVMKNLQTLSWARIDVIFRVLFLFKFFISFRKD